MPKKIIFFNHYHNGDIHLSRSFVRKIIDYLKRDNIEFSYSHKNNSSILCDIPNLIYDPNAIHNIDHNLSYKKIDDILYINTWYGQQHNHNLNKYGITFDTLYTNFDNICNNTLGLSLSSISNDLISFFPTIDYEQFFINRAIDWLKQHQSKKVFIANGHALSWQAHNFHLTPIIIDIANRHKNKIFILSNIEGNYILPSNVIYSSDIIQKEAFDLNENSFVASHCDVIIGRASGAFSFSMTKSNLFEKNIKFLCLSNLPSIANNKFWLDKLFHNKINYSSQFIISNEKNINNVVNLIEGII
jgi:hypothetical protein